MRFLLNLLIAILLFQTSRSQEKMFSFAVIADIQYGDKEGYGTRDYRGSIERLGDAVEAINAEKPDFTIQLGDFTDGYPGDTNKSAAEYWLVLNAFSKLTCPSYHTIGNHCLYSGKYTLVKHLGISSTYYQFTHVKARGWRFIVLDGNDAGYGIMSGTQLAWLDSVLGSTMRKEEKVIIFCHFPLIAWASPNHRMNAPDPVLEVIGRYENVVCYIAGHDHVGGYAYVDRVHHVTLKAMVDSPSATFAIFDVYPGRIAERGSGDEPSRSMLMDINFK